MYTSARNLRYLFAYTLPLTAAVGLWLGGAFTWLTLAYAFGLVPLIEAVVRPTPAVAGVAAATETKRHPLFDGLLYFNVPLQYGLLAYFLHTLATRNFSVAETAGAVLAVGICCGALGIDVAHEHAFKLRDSAHGDGVSAAVVYLGWVNEDYFVRGGVFIESRDEIR